jgi:hypothetical protein
MKTLTRDELEKNGFIPTRGKYGSSWRKWIVRNADGHSLFLDAIRTETNKYVVGISISDKDENEIFFSTNKLVDALNDILKGEEKMENETKYPAEVQVELHKIEHRKESIIDIKYQDCKVFEIWSIYSVTQFGLDIDTTTVLKYKDNGEWKYTYSCIPSDIAKKCMDKVGELHDTHNS